MESGLLPPNLHITKPIDADCLRNGTIKIPTEVSVFKGVTGRIGNALFTENNVGLAVFYFI